MNIRYDRDFIKAVNDQPPRIKKTIARIIKIIKTADKISEIPNCKKIKGLQSVYRIRIHEYRALFVYVSEEDEVQFIHFSLRNNAYDKTSIEKMKRKDKRK